jgi:phosphatidylinositol N-acetylglucosaminyltransferase subunit C
MEPQDQSPPPLTPRPSTPPPQPTSQPPAPPQPQPHPSSPPPVPTSTKPRTGTLTSAQKPPLPPIPQQQIAPPSQPPFPPLLHHRPFSDPNRLAPEDAYYIPQSPPRIRTENHPSKVAAAKANGAIISANGVAVGVPPVIPGLKPVLSLGSQRRRREKDRGRSGSRRQKGVWKKLLWVKQSCMC